MMHTPRSGFTLVEMIVSVGLFAIVMLVSTGAYLSLISLDRKARATNDLVTNLSFSIDTMERTLRTGSNFQCAGGTNCGGSGGTSLTFTNDQGQTVTYRYDATHHAIGQCVNALCNDTTNLTLTDPRINITNMQFYVRGVGTTGADQLVQPWATFTVTGTLTPDSLTGPITFTIQSTASQRAIEL
ncbi:MAG TPA: prepilin-type N-terminal cleavage/methylation domain-containing protein [Candidatus Paceibacterota bacterium]|nr:prepilin-type N-terminal cleavage/methylation domain-containing protein [Candidatus Paceibacterota bacterium]